MAALKPGSQQDWISNTTKGLIVKKVFLSRISCLRNNHKQSFKVVFKKKKKKLHRDSLIFILYVWSEPDVSKITAQQGATWMAKTGWLFLFPCFSLYFYRFVLFGFSDWFLPSEASTRKGSRCYSFQNY